MKTDFKEIDEGTGYIGYREAMDIIETNVRPVGDETLSLNRCAGRIAASCLAAQVSYPAVDVSLKDGFAVLSADVASANRQRSVCLKVAGSVFAGGRYEDQVKSGCAVSVCSGSPLPAGADAVVAGEFCEEIAPGKVAVKADAGPGRNILRAGIEVEAGATLVEKGEKLLPGGPSSNQMAFLQLALPALTRMGGETRHPLPTVPARLIENVKGRHPAWTEFKDAVITLDGGKQRTVALYRNRSRLQAIAGAGGLICIPEGKESLRSGDVVPVQLFAPRPDILSGY